MRTTHGIVRPDRAGRPRAGRHRAHLARTLHLLDIENLVGGELTVARLERVWTEYAAVVGTDRDDHLVVATARRNAARVAFTMPRTARLVIGEDGPDGADRALVASVDVRHDSTRFQRVIIGSGDGHFAGLAAAFAAAGVQVVTAVGAGKMSTALYLACRANIVLPCHDTPAPTTAA